MGPGVGVVMNEPNFTKFLVKDVVSITRRVDSQSTRPAIEIKTRPRQGTACPGSDVYAYTSPVLVIDL